MIHITSPTMITCLPAALNYLQRGWSPLPICPAHHTDVPLAHERMCPAPGETPLWPWQEYQRRRPSEREVRILWNRNPQSNVGIALGPVSGLLAVALFGRAAAMVEQGRAEVLPATLEFTTPRGGRRLLYAIPLDNCPPLDQALRDGEAGTVHCLSTGSYLVMPPSRHWSGGCYAWRPGHGPSDRSAALLPPWLMDARP